MRWADIWQRFGKRSERHEKAFGEGIPMHLEKQADRPYRANGYVKYMAEP